MIILGLSKSCCDCSHCRLQVDKDAMYRASNGCMRTGIFIECEHRSICKAYLEDRDGDLSRIRLLDLFQAQEKEREGLIDEQ